MCLYTTFVLHICIMYIYFVYIYIYIYMYIYIYVIKNDIIVFSNKSYISPGTEKVINNF